jgi:hypothetical protein
MPIAYEIATLTSTQWQSSYTRPGTLTRQVASSSLGQFPYLELDHYNKDAIQIFLIEKRQPTSCSLVQGTRNWLKSFIKKGR